MDELIELAELVGTDHGLFLLVFLLAFVDPGQAMAQIRREPETIGLDAVTCNEILGVLAEPGDAFADQTAFGLFRHRIGEGVGVADGRS